MGVVLYMCLSAESPFRTRLNEKIEEPEQADATVDSFFDFDFSGDDWRRVSKDAKDLIRGMLSLDPSGRLGVEEALKHRWFKDMKPQ